MRTLRFLQFFFRRIFMSFPKKRRRAKVDGDESFLAVLRHFKPFGQLDTKIARARAQDEPVLYAHVLPGLDVLLCSVRGAQPPYPAAAELRRRCIESITNALEQPLDGLENGGYWYEADGFGFLVFASRARGKILTEFGATRVGRPSRGAPAGCGRRCHAAVVKVGTRSAFLPASAHRHRFHRSGSAASPFPSVELRELALARRAAHLRARAHVSSRCMRLLIPR